MDDEDDGGMYMLALVVLTAFAFIAGYLVKALLG